MWIPNSRCRGAAPRTDDARIPRLPPSRIPQEFRVIESRLSRFSIRRSSRRSLRSINLSHYREFESMKHSSNLLFAFYWPPFDSFLLPFRSPCFSLFELKRKAVIPIYLSHCFFNVFNWHEDIEEESSLKRFVIWVISTGRTKERNFEYSSWHLSLSTQSNDSRLPWTRQRIPEIPIKLSSSILQVGRLSGNARDTNRNLPPPPKVSIKVPNRASIPLWRNVVIHGSSFFFRCKKKRKTRKERKISYKRRAVRNEE